ncbi:MAG: HDOD domain-containing protein [Rhodothermales bacterium]|nr:HDOD domain-containing protein [Rhodothermales bacterium]
MNTGSTQLFGTLSLKKLPLSETIKACSTLLSERSICANDIVNILSCDPIAVASILHRANNAFYGQQENISSLSHAVEALGPYSVARMMAESTAAETDTSIIAFTRHACATAHIAHRLVNGSWPKSGKAASKIGSVYTSGLLHSIGRLAICHSKPRESAILYGFSDSSFPLVGNLTDLEHLQFGTDHFEVGEFIALKLRFPQLLVDVIRSYGLTDQLNPEASSFRLIESISVATMISESLGYGCSSQGSFIEMDNQTTRTRFESAHPGRIEQVRTEFSETIMKDNQQTPSSQPRSIAQDRSAMNPAASSTPSAMAPIKSH